MPSIKWLCRDEQIVESETTEIFYDEYTGNASVILPEHMNDIPAVYTVVAQNDFGCAISQMEDVHIRKNSNKRVQRRKLRKAPHVTPLTAQSIRFHDTLLLQSQYGGIPVPNVVWMKNGKPVDVATDESISIETEANISRLTIADVDRKRAGKYEIVATNEVGEARASCSVMIVSDVDSADLIAPRFVEMLRPKTVLADDCVILEARVESFPLSSFQWFFESQPIVATDVIRIHSADNRAILSVDSFARDMDGMYTCRAENVAGSVTSSASVRLVDTETDLEEHKKETAPRFVNKLEPLQLMDGDALKLTCQVTGYPVPKIQWLCNKHVISETKGFHMLQDSRGICELQIPEIFVEDAGIYVCKAINKCGKATTKANVAIEGTEQKIALSQYHNFEQKKNACRFVVSVCLDVWLDRGFSIYFHIDLLLPRTSFELLRYRWFLLLWILLVCMLL